ncbi:hypothetical protein PS639_01341 [Pseudomonas fluorescens]|nr:hypothetical protein PS639_01341 [Pseudomonas fluorescens]
MVICPFYWRFYRINRRLMTSCRLRIHTSRNDIQHIAAIAQGNAAKQCEVTEYHRIRGDVAAHREVFQDLCHRTNSVTGGAEQ